MINDTVNIYAVSETKIDQSNLHVNVFINRIDLILQ